MKTKVKILSILLVIPLVALLLMIFPMNKSEAAAMTGVYMTLNRMKASLTGTDNLEIFLAFRTSASVSAGGTLVIEFPTAGNTNWCRTAGSDLTVAGVAATPGDSPAGGLYDATVALPGTLSAACTQGSGGTADKITITGVGAVNSTTTYAVQISNGTTAKLGTHTAGQHVITVTLSQGASIETKSFGLNIVSDDQVVISATVVDVQTVTCTISSNTVNLGNLYKGGTYVTGGHTIGTTTTSSAPGYYWLAYGLGNGTDAGLWKSSATTYLIESDNASSTIDIGDPGDEGFGMNLTVPAGGAVGGTGFSGNSAGVFGTLGSGVDNSEIILYKASAAATTETSTITYGARAGASAEAGSYSETVTFVCGGYY